jgi:hypothetical protein
MRTLIPVGILALLLSIAVPPAEAQVIFTSGMVSGGWVLYGSALPGTSFAAPGWVAPASYARPLVPTSSYYIPRYPLPPRIYLGYGANDVFPYSGQPYGYPYDPWTWPSLVSNPTGIAYTVTLPLW